MPADLLQRTARGLFLVGRASDVINVAGRKLHPAEIETRIAECPGVRQAIVFGVPSALRGEEPIACVVGDGIGAAAILKHCQSALSSWQLPREIWIVDQIPVNDRGKISRRLLAEIYRQSR